MHVNFYLFWSYFLGAYQFILHEQAQKELTMMTVILKKLRDSFFQKLLNAFSSFICSIKQNKTKQKFSEQMKAEPGILWDVWFKTKTHKCQHVSD